MAVELTELLDFKVHLSDIIPEKLRQESVRECLKVMMNAVEETLKFMLSHIDNHSLRKFPLLDLLYSIPNV